MDKLKRIIGLAPSEKSLEDFMERLQVERERVVAALSVPYIGKAHKPSATSIKKQARSKIEDALAQLGMTPEEFLKQ